MEALLLLHFVHLGFLFCLFKDVASDDQQVILSAEGGWELLSWVVLFIGLQY